MNHHNRKIIDVGSTAQWFFSSNEWVLYIESNNNSVEIIVVKKDF